MKNKIIALFTFLFVLGSLTANAQTTPKKTVLDISGIHFCQKHADDIMKNIEGVSSFELSPCGKHLTVFYDENKTNPGKLLEDIKSAAEAHHQACMKNEQQEQQSSCSKHPKK